MIAIMILISVVVSVAVHLTLQRPDNTFWLIEVAKKLEKVEAGVRPVPKKSSGIIWYDEKHSLPCEQGDGPCSYEKVQECCIGQVCPVGRAQNVRWRIHQHRDGLHVTLTGLTGPEIREVIAIAKRRKV